MLTHFILRRELLAKGFIQFAVGRQRHPGIEVFDRQGRTIGHGFVQPILIDIFATAKFTQRVFIVLQQRGAGEGNELGIGQAGAHKRRQKVVLTAVGLIDQHVKIGFGAQHPKVDFLATEFFPLCLERDAVGIELAMSHIALVQDVKVFVLTNPPIASGLLGIVLFI